MSYLGPDTPASDLIAHVRRTRPALVVLAATAPEHFARTQDDLAAIGRLAPVALAGAGATARLADSAGVRLLAGDPVTAAATVAAGIAQPSQSGSSADSRSTATESFAESTGRRASTATRSLHPSPRVNCMTEGDCG